MHLLCWRENCCLFSKSYICAFFCVWTLTESFRVVIKLGNRVCSIILDFCSCYSASVPYLSRRLGVIFTSLSRESLVSIDCYVLSFLMLSVLVLRLMLTESVNNDYLVSRTVLVRALIPSMSTGGCVYCFGCLDFLVFYFYFIMD